MLGIRMFLCFVLLWIIQLLPLASSGDSREQLVFAFHNFFHDSIFANSERVCAMETDQCVDAITSIDGLVIFLVSICEKVAIGRKLICVSYEKNSILILIENVSTKNCFSLIQICLPICQSNKESLKRNPSYFCSSHSRFFSVSPPICSSPVL